MDELIDILNDDGTLSGRTAMKSVAHSQGLFHATVHIWFYTKKGELLFQKRAKKKDTHPGLWDVSVAGHIGAGESMLDSAIREIQEEIGIIVPQDRLQKVGIFKSVQKHSANLIDCEFHHTFLSNLEVPLKMLTRQKSEVDDLKLIPISEFEKELTQLSKNRIYVPHSLDYYSIIIQRIKELL